MVCVHYYTCICLAQLNCKSLYIHEYMCEKLKIARESTEKNNFCEETLLSYFSSIIHHMLFKNMK